MWREIKQVYRDSGRFVVALPLIVAIPLVAEAVQHVIEWRTGMYESYAAAQAVEDHPARMQFGYVKVFTLMLMGYWVPRFLAFGERRRAVAFDGKAMTLFALVVLFGLAAMLVQKAVGASMGTWLSGGALLGAGMAALLGSMMLELYLNAWKAAAALGNARIGIPASIRVMHGNIAWSFGLLMAIFIPAILVHYALALGAIGRPPALAAAMLVVDTLVVGGLAVLFPTTAYVAARRAADRKGVALTPTERDGMAAVA